MNDSTQMRMAKGAVWMILFRLVERGLGLISTLILARLLAPQDFGVIAMALSFIAMAELLSAFSFDAAIIQNQSATPAHYNSAWTCSFVLGIGITVLMITMAYPIAQFYRSPPLFWVVIALSFGPLFTGAQNIGVVAFVKELDFRKEFRFQVSRKLISFVIVIPLAFVFRSYWALVTGILVSKLAGTVISYLMHPYRPRLELSKARELFNFSRWLLINNCAGFFKERSADFFIGRISGPQALGTYNIAYELAHLPTTEIGAPINRALLPGFARLDKSSDIAQAYAHAVQLLSLIALPIATCIYILAPFIVPVMLGNKWLAAVPLMQLLASNGALLLFHASICTVLIARGHPARVMYANLGYTVLLLGLLGTIFFVNKDIGVVGAAYAALLTSLVSTPLYLYQLHHCLGLRPGLFLRSVMRPTLACAAIALVVPALLPLHHPSMGVVECLGWLVAGGTIAVLVYALAILAAWALVGRPESAERTVLRQAQSMLQRFKTLPSRGHS